MVKNGKTIRYKKKNACERETEPGADTMNLIEYKCIIIRMVPRISTYFRMTVVVVSICTADVETGFALVTSSVEVNIG